MMTDVVVVGEMISECVGKLMKPLKESGVNVVGASEFVSDALLLLNDNKPSVVVMDFGVDAQHDLGMIRLIRAKSQSSRILLITKRTPEELILDALTVGARGYLEYEACGVFLAKAVEAIALGEAWIARKLVAAMLDRVNQYAEQTHLDELGQIHSASSSVH
jgi:DNA-binding NarL/FixJ family response regulator